MKHTIKIRFIVLALMILATGMWRVAVADPSFSSIPPLSPVGAMALFAGTFLTNRFAAYITPVLILFISDMVLQQFIYPEFRSGLLYSGWYWTYSSFLLMVLVGERLKKGSAFRSVVVGSLVAAGLHFFISNFGVWFSGNNLDVTTGMPYTKDWNGLIKCYFLALPFVKSLLLGNLLYGTILFGGFKLIQWKFPLLRVYPSFNE